MKARVAAVAGVILLIAVSLSSPCAAAQAQCSNDDFKGVYGATAIGSFTAPPVGFPGGATARLAKVEVDGKGIAHITATLALDGLIFPESYPGTYTVYPDCSITVILQVQFPGIGAVPFTFSGVLTANGTAEELILVDPQGNDVRISEHKQIKTGCTNADLQGDYALQMSGVSIFQFAVPTGPVARVGKASFDGAGGFKAAVNANYNGRIIPEALKGSYSMNADCTFTVTFPLLYTWTWAGVLTDTNSGAYLMQSAPVGAVVIGTLSSVQ